MKRGYKSRKHKEIGDDWGNKPIKRVKYLKRQRVEESSVEEETFLEEEWNT